MVFSEAVPNLGLALEHHSQHSAGLTVDPDVNSECVPIPKQTYVQGFQTVSRVIPRLGSQIRGQSWLVSIRVT